MHIITLGKKLLDRDGDWKIYDVAIDGISMVANYRSSFSNRIRRSGTRLGSLLFVIDDDQRLRGVIDVEGLLGARDNALLGELMQKNVTRVSPQASLATVVSLSAWDRALSLPVTDRNRRLVGVLHFDSLREGLLAERGPEKGPQINVLVVHLVQAFLVVLAGLMHTATTEPGLSRLTSDGES